MRHMRSQDGARNSWPAPTTELWAPTPNGSLCRGHQHRARASEVAARADD